MARAPRARVIAGTLREAGKDQAVTIPSDSLHEPSFHTVFSSGQRQFVLSGNKEFSTGDRLQRPRGGAARAAGKAPGQGGGEGEDGFRFVLTRDEFLDLFFEDLELPDLVKNQIVATETMSPTRAGIAVDGSPSQIDMGAHDAPVHGAAHRPAPAKAARGAGAGAGGVRARAIRAGPGAARRAAGRAGPGDAAPRRGCRGSTRSICATAATP